MFEDYFLNFGELGVEEIFLGGLFFDGVIDLMFGGGGFVLEVLMD